MAVREIATNNYFKINFDSCAVRGLKVFVNFSAYQSTDEREKEKERVPKWAEFFQKLRENLHTQYSGLLAAIAAAGLTPEQVLSQTEENKIDAEIYPALRAAQDKMNDLEPYEKSIGAGLFRYEENENQPLVIPGEVSSELAALGFDEAWVTDPIVLNGGAEVYTGDYNGEPITHEFFYERLKSVMGETEDC